MRKILFSIICSLVLICSIAVVGIGQGGIVTVEASQDGYTFEGWYWDKDTWEKAFTANSLLEAPLFEKYISLCKMIRSSTAISYLYHHI